MTEIPPPHTVHENCAFCDRREAEIARLTGQLKSAVSQIGLMKDVREERDRLKADLAAARRFFGDRWDDFEERAVKPAAPRSAENQECGT